MLPNGAAQETSPGFVNPSGQSSFCVDPPDLARRGRYATGAFRPLPFVEIDLSA